MRSVPLLRAGRWIRHSVGQPSGQIALALRVCRCPGLDDAELRAYVKAGHNHGTHLPTGLNDLRKFRDQSADAASRGLEVGPLQSGFILMFEMTSWALRQSVNDCGNNEPAQLTVSVSLG